MMAFMKRRKWLQLSVIILLVTTLILTIQLYSSPECTSPKLILNNKYSQEDTAQSFVEDHKLAVIVPFRDRFDELMVFVPHLHNYLVKLRINHKIYIMNQVDDYRFNRAALINVGFLESRSEGCTYIAMHDVDLLPLNTDLPYTYPADGPMHIAAPNLHPLYHYDKYIGGILLINNQHFEKVNGMTNIFWGWGREDDELYVRLKQAQLKIYRPENIDTGYQTFRHIHDRRRRKRDTALYYNQKQLTKRRDYLTGLNNVDYEITGRHQLTVDGASVTVYNVRLHCDSQLTPYCQIPTETPKIRRKS